MSTSSILSFKVNDAMEITLEEHRSNAVEKRRQGRTLSFSFSVTRCLVGGDAMTSALPVMSAANMSLHGV